MKAKPITEAVLQVTSGGPGGRRWQVAKAVGPLVSVAVERLGEVLNRSAGSDAAIVAAASAVLRHYTDATGAQARVDKPKGK